MQKLPEKVARLDEFTISLKPDLLHWIYPLHYQIGDVPDICTVHDLNYEHLLEGFEEDYIRWRRLLMAAQIDNCRALVAISKSVALDISDRYRSIAERLHIVQWAPFIGSEVGSVDVDNNNVMEQRLLDDQFIFYPAATYRHKNHQRLFKALQLINNSSRGGQLKLVLTGPVTQEWKELQREFSEELERGTIVHLGFVPQDTLRSLYQNCAFVVFPSLFEGAGLPLLEAISYGKKICCSDIPVFHEYGGKYPVYFDPECVELIAEAMLSCVAEWQPRSSAPELRTWFDIADEYLEIYSEVLGNQNGSKPTHKRSAATSQRSPREETS